MKQDIDFMNKSRIGRVINANSLIRFVSSRGRNFFLDGGEVGKFVYNNYKLYYVDEYSKSSMIMKHKDDWYNSSDFSHGGGLKFFIKCLRDFIFNGDKLVVQHQHWGYSKKDMHEITQEAINLGMEEFVNAKGGEQ